MCACVTKFMIHGITGNGKITLWSPLVTHKWQYMYIIMTGPLCGMTSSLPQRVFRFGLDKGVPLKPRNLYPF